MDSSNGNYEPRVRCTVYRFEPIDENKEVDNLITIIEHLCL